MERDFDLGTILTFTTGINCTDDFLKAYELVWFVFNDNHIPATGLEVVKDKLKDHLLSIHPQLKDINYNPQFETSFEAWLLSQKREYGETLPVSQIDYALEKNGKVK